MNGGMVQTEHRVDCIEELGLLTSRRVRHRRFPQWRPEIADNWHRAKLPGNPTHIAFSGQNCLSINGSASNRHGFVGEESIRYAAGRSDNTDDTDVGLLCTHACFVKIKCIAFSGERGLLSRHLFRTPYLF